MVTSNSPVASVLSMVARSGLTLEVSAERLRSRLKTTASALKGVPSWKVTPSSSVSTRVWGSVKSKAFARLGIGARVWKSHSISVS